MAAAFFNKLNLLFSLCLKYILRNITEKAYKVYAVSKNDWEK